MNQEEKQSMILSASIASMLTDDMLVDLLQRAIDEYRLNHDFETIAAIILIAIQRDAVKRHGGVEKTIEAFEGFKKIKNVFDHTENKS